MRKPTEGEIEHEDVETAVCPACGYEHTGAWEWPLKGIMYCYHCDTKFSYEKIVRVTYTTRKIES